MPKMSITMMFPSGLGEEQVIFSGAAHADASILCPHFII